MASISLKTFFRTKKSSLNNFTLLGHDLTMGFAVVDLKMVYYIWKGLHHGIIIQWQHNLSWSNMPNWP